MGGGIGVVVEARGGWWVWGFISRETGRAAVCRWWLAGAPQLGPPPAWPPGALLFEFSPLCCPGEVRQIHVSSYTEIANDTG